MVPDAVMGQILAAIHGVRFGSVQLTIHDGHVVQIEKREKVRIHMETDRTTGGIPTTSRSQRPGGTS